MNEILWFILYAALCIEVMQLLTLSVSLFLAVEISKKKKLTTEMPSLFYISILCTSTVINAINDTIYIAFQENY